MDLLRNRSSFSRLSVTCNDNAEAEYLYNGGDKDVDVYATAPLFEDAPSPSFPVTIGETDMARQLGIRGEVCTAVFAPRAVAIVRKGSVIFQAPYSSIKSYGLKTEALYVDFGRVELHGEGSLVLQTKYNRAMKECFHVNLEHVRRS